MNEIEKKMIEKINIEISFAKSVYDIYGCCDEYSRAMTKINGMIDILKIYTNKEYCITRDGLEEM